MNEIHCGPPLNGVETKALKDLFFVYAVIRILTFNEYIEHSYL